jgi:hypothetical protein
VQDAFFFSLWYEQWINIKYPWCRTCRCHGQQDKHKINLKFVMQYNIYTAWWPALSSTTTDCSTECFSHYLQCFLLRKYFLGFNGLLIHATGWVTLKLWSTYLTKPTTYKKERIEYGINPLLPQISYITAGVGSNTVQHHTMMTYGHHGSKWCGYWVASRAGTIIVGTSKITCLVMNSRLVLCKFSK